MNQKQQLRKLELYAKMQAIRDKVATEKRTMTAAERQEWEGICKEFDQLTGKTVSSGNQYTRRYRQNPVTAWLNSHLQHAAI